jgi:hypothetical protein
MRRPQSVETKPKINSLITGGFISTFSTHALVASLLCKYAETGSEKNYEFIIRAVNVKFLGQELK